MKKTLICAVLLPVLAACTSTATPPRIDLGGGNGDGAARFGTSETQTVPEQRSDPADLPPPLTSSWSLSATEAEGRD